MVKINKIGLDSGFFSALLCLACAAGVFYVARYKGKTRVPDTSSQGTTSPVVSDTLFSTVLGVYGFCVFMTFMMMIYDTSAGILFGLVGACMGPSLVLLYIRRQRDKEDGVAPGASLVLPEDVQMISAGAVCVPLLYLLVRMALGTKKSAKNSAKNSVKNSQKSGEQSGQSEQSEQSGQSKKSGQSGQSGQSEESKT